MTYLHNLPTDKLVYTLAAEGVFKIIPKKYNTVWHYVGLFGSEGTFPDTYCSVPSLLLVELRSMDLDC